MMHDNLMTCLSTSYNNYVCTGFFAAQCPIVQQKSKNVGCNGINITKGIWGHTPSGECLNLDPLIYS